MTAGNPYLLTARHVVTGKDDETKRALHPSGAVPHTLRIWHNPPNWRTRQASVDEPLYEDEDQEVPRWLERVTLFDDDNVDVAALPIPPMGPRLSFDIQHRTYDLAQRRGTAELEVGDRLHIVGFPSGIRSDMGELAVWCTGWIATDPATSWRGPRFLIDSRTRKGQSGSPVISYSRAHTTQSPDGRFIHKHEEQVELVGLYSGRINAESDLGSVWTRSVIDQIVPG